MDYPEHSLQRRIAVTAKYQYHLHFLHQKVIIPLAVGEEFYSMLLPVGIALNSASLTGAYGA